MKTLFLIILAVIVIIIGFFIRNRSSIENIVPTTPVVMETLTLESGERAIDTAASSFKWTGKKTIIKDWIDTGSVTASSGRVLVSPEGQVTGGTLSIDMNTLTATTTGSGSGQDKLSTHLKSADFFDVATYPVATIIVNRIADGMAYGDITIKGITKSVEFPVMISSTDGIYTITGKISLNRTWFNVQFGSKAFFADLADKMIIDDVFSIDFNIVTK
jgi:polyisoprenoid-binding protein YceI